MADRARIRPVLRASDGRFTVAVRHCPACGERVVRELPGRGEFEAMYHCYACRGDWNESETVALSVEWVPCPVDLDV